MLEQWQFVREQAKEVKEAWPSVLALCLLAVAVSWFGASLFYSERIETLTTQRDGFKDQLDRLQPVEPVLAVDLNCEPQLMPAAPTFNERLEVYEIDRGDQSGRMLAGIWGHKAEEGLPRSIRCDVINRGNVPLANFWLDIDVVFKAAVRGPGRIGSGDTVGNHQRTFIVPGVAEVGGQPITFWIRNSNGSLRVRVGS